MNEGVLKPPPCLYMLWPEAHEVGRQRVGGGYSLRVYRDGDDEQLIELNRSDGDPMTREQWRDYLDRVLPGGLYVGEHLATGTIVATAGAAHNPNPGRYYFPFGGELGYFVVGREHRRRGLGTAVCGAVVHRFLSAGYGSIRVCVQEHREAAIRTYLGVGFEPFLHAPEVAHRWQRVCGAIGVAFTPEVWPTQLPANAGRQAGWPGDLGQ